MLSQCKKKDLQYKMAAIEVTGSVLHALNTDVFSDFFEIILQSIKPVSWTTCILMSMYILKPRLKRALLEPHIIIILLWPSQYVCIQANKGDSDSEDEAETKRQNSAAKLNLQATAFQAIGLAWPDSTHTQGSTFYHA